MTPGEIQALISAVIGGVVVAAIGGVVAWRVAIGQRAHERAEARASRAHELAMAREERRQSRIGELYVDVLEFVEIIRGYVDLTAPMVAWLGMPGPPALPSEADQRRLNARIAAFGSKEIREQVIAARRKALEFQTHVGLWEEMKEWLPSTDRTIVKQVQDAFDAYVADREAFHELHDATTELVNEELDASSVSEGTV